MKLLLTGVALAFWCGCAPLTQPVLKAGIQSGVAADPNQGPAGPSALQAYLEARRQQAAVPAIGTPYVAVVPMVDRSEFRKGVWDIQQEIAGLLSARLATVPRWQVVPFAAVAEAAAGAKGMDPDKAVATGRFLGAVVVLLGTIRDYNMERLAVGDPVLGGYKSYKGTAALEVQVLRAQDGGELGVLDTRQEITDRDVGLDLLGKPRPQDVQFAGLANMAFGGDEFKSTSIGQATLAAADEVVRKLGEMLQPAGLGQDEAAGSVLSVHGEEVYIDLGSESGLRPGHRFAVFAAAGQAPQEAAQDRRPIGVVEVQEVIGGRLSRVRVIDGQGRLAAGDQLAPLAPGP